MSETSASLLERLRAQPDGDSWQRLVRLYTPLLHGWLHRYGLQSSDIDDLVQDVLAVLVRELPRFQHNQRPGAFRSWLRTITVHRLRDFWRKRQSRPVATGESDLLRVLKPCPPAPLIQGACYPSRLTQGHQRWKTRISMFLTPFLTTGPKRCMIGRRGWLSPPTEKARGQPRPPAGQLFFSAPLGTATNIP